MSNRRSSGAGQHGGLSALGSEVQNISIIREPLKHLGITKTYAPRVAVSDPVFDDLYRDCETMPEYLDDVCFSLTFGVCASPLPLKMCSLCKCDSVSSAAQGNFGLTKTHVLWRACRPSMTRTACVRQDNARIARRTYVRVFRSPCLTRASI